MLTWHTVLLGSAMNKMISLSVAALSALAFAASAQAAASLSNGDFTTPAVSGANAPAFQTFSASTPDYIGSWKVSSGTVDLIGTYWTCLLYTSPSPRDRQKSRMPSSA